MVQQPLGPRKQRTREHVIADLSRNHVERFILEEGFTADRPDYDYGYDLFLTTYDSNGYVEPDMVRLQLKGAENLEQVAGAFVFDMDIRDFTLWTNESMPVILVLYDASSRKAYWLHVQGYFVGSKSRKPKPGAKSVRVRVPPQQRFNRRAVRFLIRLKEEAADQFRRGKQR